MKKKLTAVNVEYLGLNHDQISGIGVGLITFRKNITHPLSLSLQRAALERLRDDLNSLLENPNLPLSNQATINKSQREKIVVKPEVLEKLGLTEIQPKLPK
jgi:hypothetical protein